MILCVGGSASVDGGTGALQEMGLTIVNNSLNRNYITGIKDINIELLQQRFKGIHITILCDVDNPICGPEGAAAVFAPQKGASPEQVVMLDNQLCLWSALLKQHTGKDVTRLKHGGAAGGITAAMHALLNAQLVSGSEYCLTLSHFHDNLLQAGIVITGEGKIDGQSLRGKVVIGISRRAMVQNVPVYAVVGDVGDDATAAYDMGVTAIFSTNRVAVPFSIAKTRSKQDFQAAFEDIMRLMKTVEERR